MNLTSFRMMWLLLVYSVGVNQATYTSVLTPTKDVCNKQDFSFTKSKNVCERIVRPALTKSLFPNITPTINFVPEGEEVQWLPWNVRKFLKWKLTFSTQDLLIDCLTRIGFQLSEDVTDWLGRWTKFVNLGDFTELRDYQKLNHFCGTFQIVDKDKMVASLTRMQMLFGEKEFEFFPHTYVIPKDLPSIKRTFDEGDGDQWWIIKPPKACQGDGITIVNKFTEIPRRKNWIVQRYSTSPESFENRFVHLTNYHVNYLNKNFRVNDSDTADRGHKWSLTALWNYLERQGINTEPIWDRIVDIIIKTLISVDTTVNYLTKAINISSYNMHELLGFGVLLDENLDPWLLEVNRLPSLAGASNLTYKMNSRLVVDLLNTAGFRIPDGKDIDKKYQQKLERRDLRYYRPSNNVYNDKRVSNQRLSQEEEAKHAYYIDKHNDKQDLQSILDTLTSDDIRILTETIDEESRSAGFIRIFPTPSTHKYMKYFETPRYYNLLVDHWVQLYNQNEDREEIDVFLAAKFKKCIPSLESV